MTTTVRRCEICGREGTKQFRVIPAVTYPYEGREVTIPAITECLGRISCQRRARRLRTPTERAADRLSWELMNT